MTFDSLNANQKVEVIAAGAGAGLVVTHIASHLTNLSEALDYDQHFFSLDNPLIQIPYRLVSAGVNWIGGTAHIVFNSDSTLEYYSRMNQHLTGLCDSVQPTLELMVRAPVATVIGAAAGAGVGYLMAKHYAGNPLAGPNP
ncbi:MAG: hypothetical protein KJ601_06055 [Nanoarchaeota archaeon]|nr:hypothetical protein [Nanoarchaeota archaeon]MBU1703925.1 hypothetical protein [Nanoarchaeota archaeon]